MVSVERKRDDSGIDGSGSPHVSSSHGERVGDADHPVLRPADPVPPKLHMEARVMEAHKPDYALPPLGLCADSDATEPSTSKPYSSISSNLDTIEPYSSISSRKRQSSACSAVHYASYTGQIRPYASFFGAPPPPPQAVFHHGQQCEMCGDAFSFFRRRHHCRRCCASVCQKHFVRPLCERCKPGDVGLRPDSVKPSSRIDSQSTNASSGEARARISSESGAIAGAGWSSKLLGQFSVSWGDAAPSWLGSQQPTREPSSKEPSSKADTLPDWLGHAVDAGRSSPVGVATICGSIAATLSRCCSGQRGDAGDGERHHVLR